MFEQSNFPPLPGFDNMVQIALAELSAKMNSWQVRTENFQRTVRLPMNVVADEAKAKCKDGILTIHLPKAEPNGVKKMAIQ